MLKSIYLKIIQMLPPALTGAMAARLRRTQQMELEAERLDRIRNPAKYRGK